MLAISCGECGIEFAVPDHWLTKRKEDKRTFYCPNGHARAFIESEAERLRRELTRQKQLTEQLEARAEPVRPSVKREMRGAVDREPAGV